MDTDVLNILNDSACDNVQIMLPASQKLEFLNDSKEMRNFLYRSIAHLIFSENSTNLTDGGKFIGFIYLKNAMSNCVVWQYVDLDVKKEVQHLLFIYLSAGQDNERYFNKHEDVSGIGRILTDIVSCYVKQEWIKSKLSDDFWEHLIQLYAWSSLRAGIKAVSIFRLPVRRKVFNCLIKLIFPTFIKHWHCVLDNLNDNTLVSAIRLSRLLYTCLTLCDNFGKENDNETFFSSLHSVLMKSFVVFEQIVVFGNKLEYQKLVHRLTKLILSIFMSLNPHGRNNILEFVLGNIFAFLPLIDVSNSIVNRQSIKWFLAVIYGSFCSKVPQCGSQLFLTTVGEEKLCSWMSQTDISTPDGRVVNKWIFLIMCLIEKWFVFTRTEVSILAHDPEACLASGGSSNLESAQSNVDSNSIWNCDSQAKELTKLDLASLVGIRNSSSHHLLSTDPCRQMIELLFVVFARFYKEYTAEVFLELAQLMMDTKSSRHNDAVAFESLCRLVQLCLPYFGSDSRWIALTKSLLQDGLTMFGNQQQHSAESCVALGRILCLLPRFSLFCVDSSSQGADCNSQLQMQCTESIQQLDMHLKRPSNWNPNGDSAKSILMIRLSAVYALAWFIDHPLLPDCILVPYMESLLNGLVELIEDVKECETRIFILDVLHHLIEMLDLLSYPNLTNSMFGTLDTLWQLADTSAPLRASILNTLSILVSGLYAHKEPSPEYASFIASIQHPMTSLIQISIQAQSSHCCISGSEALFNPGLRLWTALVEGPGSIWSDHLVQLMPILVGQNETNRSLIDRVDSAEEAELVFRIAKGMLRLSQTADFQTFQSFVSTWCEPFMSSLLRAHQSAAGSSSVNLEELYTQAALSVADEQSDHESKYRLYQLEMLIIWLTVYLDIIDWRTCPMSPLTPSLVGLIIVAGQACLVQAPVSSHTDVCACATELRLSLLARLVVYPHMWTNFTRLLDIVNTECQLPLYSMCHYFDSMPNRLQSSSFELWEAVKPVMDRWLCRADSLQHHVDRRCFALACLTTLKHCARTYDASAMGPLNEWVIQDKIHEHWLEPVINLIIQVLFDECNTTSVDENLTFYCSYPTDLSTASNMRKRIRLELGEWEAKVGGRQVVHALLDCHLDSVLRRQLDEQLNVNE